MVFGSKSAMHMTLIAQTGPFNVQLEFIDVDGKHFSRLGKEKFTESAFSNKASASVWASATNAKLIGEETLLGDKAWHVQARSDGSPFDVWVREKDGYPVKYQGGLSSGSGQIALQFNSFNLGTRIDAPTAAQIKQPPRNITGAIGNPLTLSDGATVTILAVNTNAQTGNRYSEAKPGNRFVTVDVLYDNTRGTDKVSYRAFGWTIADSQGYNYDSTYAAIEPSLRSGDLNVGDKVRGIITFEVPKTATGLQVKTKFGDDTWAVPIS